MRPYLPCGIAALLALGASTAEAERIRFTAPDGIALKAHWLPRDAFLASRLKSSANAASPLPGPPALR